MDNIVALLQALEHSRLAVAIAGSAWAFPIIETIHVIALTLTVGTVLIVDLRLLGLASTGQAYVALRREVLPWTWGAFGLAVVSGSLMFMTQASEYFVNEAFRIKFALMALAGVNMAVFELIVSRRAGDWDRGLPIPLRGRIAAALSLALWASIVFFGRRVGFTMVVG